MADDVASILPPDPEDQNKLPEKKKLAWLGVFLTVVAAVMLIGSIVSLTILMKVSSVKDLFLTVTNHHAEADSVMIAFRVIVVILIALALLQLITNTLFTAAVIKDKVELIYRHNVRYSVVTTLAASCFSVLVMTILGSETHMYKKGKAGMLMFVVGILHASITVYIFMTIQNQRKEAAKKKLADEELYTVSSSVAN